MRKSNLRFNIAPLKSYYGKDGSKWINPNHQHEPQDGLTDHRDAGQWSFFVVAERNFRQSEEHRIVETQQIAARCGIVDFRQAVEKVTADCA